MYLMGPTSTSSLRNSACSSYLVRVSFSISVVAALTRSCCSLTSVSTDAVSPLPNWLRRRSIRRFDSTTCVSTVRRTRAISSLAARIVGLLLACSSLATASVRSRALAACQLRTAAAVPGPQLLSTAVPTRACALSISLASINFCSCSDC